VSRCLTLSAADTLEAAVFRSTRPISHLPQLLVPTELINTDITGQMILLGTGTSVGVPAIGCGCAVCRSANPKNCRTRCSAILGLPGGNLLIDTAPDMRAQLLREEIGLVHAVLYTHEHADHVFGLDDLRLMQFYLGGPVPLYCEAPVEARIRKSYDYAFTSATDLHPGAVPQLVFRRITTEPFDVLGAHFTPVRLRHGSRCDVLGFRIGNVAYCTDVNAIPPASLERLDGLDCLVLDALRPRGHATHFSLEEAVAVARQLKPRQTYFTHMSHELEHEATNAQLPEGMELAYDGLRIPLA
jgi:phosphoribosyl 1,2-cyclic phosphate phosphodiesterase